MVKFQAKSKEDKLQLEEAQFVSIRISDGTNPLTVFNHVVNKYPEIENCYFDSDNEEVVIEASTLSNVGEDYRLKLCKLRETANEIAKSEVTCFILTSELGRNNLIHTMKNFSLPCGHQLCDMRIEAKYEGLCIRGSLKTPEGDKYQLPYNICCIKTDEGLKMVIVDHHHEIPADIWEKIESSMTNRIEHLIKTAELFDTAVEFHQCECIKGVVK